MDRPDSDALFDGFRGRAIAVQSQGSSDHALKLATLDALTSEANTFPEPVRRRCLGLVRALEVICHISMGDIDLAFDAAMEADELARSLDDTRLQAESWKSLALCFRWVGRHDDALSWLERAREHLGPASDPHIPGFSSVLASQYRSMGRLADAAALFDELLADPPDNERARLVLQINAASCYWQIGRAPEGEELVSAALEATGEDRFPDLHGWALAIGAWTAAANDDMAAAERRARRVLEKLDSSDLVTASSAARAMSYAATRRRDDPRMLEVALKAMQSVIAPLEERGLLGEALTLHADLAAAFERRGELVTAVHHLGRVQQIRAALDDQDRRLRQRGDRMRTELLRAKLEAEHLRIRQAQVERANRALAAADAARTRLVETIAHDLRNALQALAATVEFTNRDDAEDVARTFQDIDEAISVMDRILHGALSGPSASGEVGWCDLRDVVQGRTEAFRGLAQRRDQRLLLIAAGPAQVRGDPVELGRVVDNLLSNALKFSDPGTTVEVELAVDGRRARLHVRDQGPGFAGVDPAAGLLFGHQLAARDGDTAAGLGIGLHTVFELVARLGGTLQIGNRPGGGAEVVVSVEAAPEGAAVAAS